MISTLKKCFLFPISPSSSVVNHLFFWAQRGKRKKEEKKKQKAASLCKGLQSQSGTESWKKRDFPLKPSCCFRSLSSKYSQSSSNHHLEAAAARPESGDQCPRHHPTPPPSRSHDRLSTLSSLHMKPDDLPFFSVVTLSNKRNGRIKVQSYLCK